MKLWKYQHYSELTHSIKEGELKKEPYIWAVEQPDFDYFDVTTREKRIEREIELIKTRKTDGVNAYQETQADLRITRLDAGIDGQTFQALVYSPMANVILNVANGDWLNAYYALELVQTNQILSDDMKTSFRIKIGGYIVNSGNYDEFSNSTISIDGFIQ